MDILKFRPKLLAASVTAAIAASAHGQDTAPEEPLTPPPSEGQITENNLPLEEVVVYGIRASMQRSMDMKRFSKGVVDAISAEEIGKFPDTNLAESLQRITGVAIERDRGEGSKITVRGFGPDFNLVTFNSRQMPTTGGRSFDFGNIASEGISAVEVYKSGRANVATGGIGAVVNVKTNKPLDNPGTQAVVSLKGVHDKSTRDGDDITPEFAGLFSKTFDDDTFGVALSMSYQERDGGTQSAVTQDFMGRNFVTQEDIDNEATDAEWGSIPVGDPDAIGFPSEVNDGIYAIPTNIQYNQEEFTRERINGQLTLQWRPFDSLTGTIDYTYAENKYETLRQDLSAWFDPACTTRESEWVQEGKIWSPTVYRDVGCSKDNLQGVGKFATVNENKSAGFNLVWEPNDNLTVSLDYHDSSGEEKPDSKYGSNGFVAVAALNRITSTAHFSPNGMPIMEVELGERNSFNQITRIDDFDANDMQVSGSRFDTWQSRMDVEQLQLDGHWQFESGHSVYLGVAAVEVENRGQSTSVARNTWSGVGEPGDIADLLKLESIDGVFSDLEGGNDPRMRTEFFSWNFADMIDRAETLLQEGSHGNVDGDGGPCLTGFCPSYDFGTDEVTTEETESVYLQTHFVFDVLNRPSNLYMGVRYEQTDVDSQALVPLPDRVEWSIIDNNLRHYTQRDEDGNEIQGFTRIQGDYDVTLPSIDFDIEVVDDVILRASYSETISRPHYNDLKGALNIWGVSQDGASGGRGNPQLKPMEAKNVDLSLEWYYGETSYISVGYWTKDVENFINSATFEDQRLFEDLHTPIDGPMYDQAIEDITGGDPTFEYTNEDVNAYYAENYADMPNVEVTGEGDDIEVVVTGSGSDPVLLFDVTMPINERDAKVDGWEIMVQHVFGDSGFGYQANYTYVDPELEYDINLNEEQWVVPGMSDTANFVGFYDKDGIQVRVAYNWRDEYLESAARDPRFVEEYEQWDVNASYSINDNFTIFLEGINVTEENRRVHGRSKYQVRHYEVGHARYNLGFRYVF